MTHASMIRVIKGREMIPLKGVTAGFEKVKGKC